jgi:DNA-binding FadR family transcriptional regulator
MLAAPIEVRAIRDSAERSLAAGRAVDAEAFAQADTQFHDSIGVAAHNVFLRAGLANIRRLASQSDVLLFHGDVPGSLEVAGAQHVAIAEAIAAGEVDTAAELMTEHINTTQNQFERKIRDRLFTLADRPAGASVTSRQPAKPAPSSRQGPSRKTSAS